MYILSIETSCDETSLAIIEARDEHIRVCAHQTLSQMALHAQYGGVFPNLAKREHARNLTPLLVNILAEAKVQNNSSDTNTIPHKEAVVKICTELLDHEPDLCDALIPFLSSTPKPTLDAICVTYGPGLEPALWVGINCARVLGMIWDIPVIPVNHMEGHVVSIFAQGESFEMKKPEFPALALLVSGGHTELVIMRGWRNYKKIGATRDDAIGEAFDKVARLLELPYPGGPQISRLAAEFENRLANENISSRMKFPRPMVDSGDYDFSFSGLKTAVRREVEKWKQTTFWGDFLKSEIAYEFELAATDVILIKTKRALEEYDIRTLIVAGGVVANKRLRKELGELVKLFPDCTLHLPTSELATDNALMIAIAGYAIFQEKKHSSEEFSAHNPLRAQGNLELE